MFVLPHPEQSSKSDQIPAERNLQADDDVRRRAGRFQNLSLRSRCNIDYFSDGGLMVAKEQTSRVAFLC